MVKVGKTYETLKHTFKSYKMKVGDIIQRVEFTGGIDLGVKGRTAGKLFTEDKELQEAIESSPLFNREIFLRKESKNHPKKAVKTTDTEESEGGDTGAVEPIVLDGISAVNAAKLKLKEVFGEEITQEDLKNMGTITEFCKKNNVKIPDLIKES